VRGAGATARRDGIGQPVEVLGVQPAMGRRFLASEDEPHSNEGADSIILSDRTWREQFGGATTLLGRMIALDGRAFRVVGVMPHGFEWRLDGTQPDFWTTAAPLAERGPIRRGR